MGKMKEIMPREFAQRRGIRLDSVYAMIWARKIPARKEEGRWLIPESAVEKSKNSSSRG